MECMVAMAHFPIFSFRLDDRLIRFVIPFPAFVHDDLLALGVGAGVSALRGPEGF